MTNDPQQPSQEREPRPAQPAYEEPSLRDVERPHDQERVECNRKRQERPQ